MIEYTLTIIGVSALGFALFLASRWAWNRRAERLSREGDVPEAVAAVVPGVWPPPPEKPKEK